MSSAASFPFAQLPAELKDYLNQRAANYDHMSGEELYELLPSDLYGWNNEILVFLQGSESLGLEPTEVMHLVSEANGGLDVPSNLILGPRSLNRSIGSANMTEADITEVERLNDITLDVLLDDSTVLPDLIGAGEAATTVAVTSAEVLPAAVDLAEVAEPGLAEIVGEALVEGIVPAIMAAKAGMAVADRCTTTEDKLGYGAAAAGGTALLYLNPVTGPIAWTATGIYGSYKLVRLGQKLAPHIARQVELHRARTSGTWAV